MSTATTHPKRNRGGTQPLPLTRDDIVRAALPLLARRGADELTMREVADVLGISSPALYHHFAGRDELIDRLCEQVAAEVDLAIDTTMPWDDAVVTVLSNMDDTFAKYPGVAARVLSGRRRSPAADRITATVRSLIQSGCVDDDATDELLAALQFLFGGWLLARRAAHPRSAVDPAMLDRSIRWLLRGFKERRQ
jgi:TetR/AcrR family transcriptional regulator, tetracycline repressor protein